MRYLTARIPNPPLSRAIPVGSGTPATTGGHRVAVLLLSSELAGLKLPKGEALYDIDIQDCVCGGRSRSSASASSARASRFGMSVSLERGERRDSGEPRLTWNCRKTPARSTPRPVGATSVSPRSSSARRVRRPPRRITSSAICPGPRPGDRLGVDMRWSADREPW